MKTIQSKAGELILVPVPKGYDFNIEDDYWSVYITGVNTKGERHLIWFNDIFNRFPHLEKGIDRIIGLSSQLTEEQWEQIDCSDYGERRRVLERIFEMLEDGTLVEYQDCLILLKKEK